MGVLAGAKQAPGLAQRLDDRCVGLAHVQPGERPGALVERAVGPDRVVDGDPVLGGQAEVVLTEGRTGVDHAGAVLGGHEVAGEHRVAVGPVVAQVGEGRLVAQPEQLRPGEALLHLGLLAQHPLHQRLGQDQALLAEPGAHVGHVRIHRHRGVGHQRPGHRGPGEQRHTGLVAQRELHEHRGVDGVLVAHRHLVARQRGAAARAVGHDLVALREQPLVEDLLERPPDGLDVGVVEREVGVVGVDPVADPLRQAVPLVDVAQHRLAALGVELGHAVALDVLLGLEAELLLDLQLDRQPVAVPAALALDVVPLHRLVARKDVLEDAREHVMRARAAVGGGRPLVEDERRRPLAATHRLGEHVALAPARQHLLFEGGERLRGVHRAVASHGAVDCRRGFALAGFRDRPPAESPNRSWQEAGSERGTH